MADFTSPSKRGPWWSTTVIAVIVSLIIGFAGGLMGGQLAIQQAALNNGQKTGGEPLWSASDNNQPTNNKINLPPSVLNEENTTVTVAKAASQAVVSIIVSKKVTATPISPNDFFFNFGWPFEWQIPQAPSSGQEGKLQQVGGGSGFVVRSNGLIITNKHVVADTQAVFTVKTASGKEYGAKVLARDPVNDIAFLKIEASNLPTLPLGDSDKIQIGQTVMAIGYSLGEYPNSLTKGIISGIRRDVVAGDSQGQAEQLTDVIQTDAAINPGNSGGPLINLSGEVIGINTAIDQQGQLVGFAIPINVAKSALQSFERSGKISRPFLGVRYVNLDADIAKENKLPVNDGAYLQPGPKDQPTILPGSPAEQAGLKENDIITKVNNQALTDDFTLSQAINQAAVGDTLTLVVNRAGKNITIQATLAERPAS